jgi:hypothetical protein
VLGGHFVNTFNGCHFTCPCPYPPLAEYDVCDEIWTPCVPTTTTKVPVYCTGGCEWFGIPQLGAWYLIDWSCHGSGVDYCNCEPPSILPTNCGPASTPCKTRPTTTTTSTTSDPCNPTTSTTTTVNPCDGNCKFVSNSAGTGWQLERSCPSECPCRQPAYNPSFPNEIAFVSCNTAETTTTTTTTTTTPAPCSGNCNWECFPGGFNNQGQWLENPQDQCGSNCGCEPNFPAGPCTTGSVVSSTCQNIGSTTTTTTTTSTSTTPPPVGACCTYVGPCFACSDVTESECNGAWFAQPCSSTDCDTIQGACCINGNCSMMTCSVCASAGGTWFNGPCIDPQTNLELICPKDPLEEIDP